MRLKNLKIGSKHPASKRIYSEINQVMKKLDRFINFMAIEITIPCLVLPKSIVCYYTYLTNGMENDAFELLLPVW